MPYQRAGSRRKAFLCFRTIALMIRQVRLNASLYRERTLPHTSKPCSFEHLADAWRKGEFSLFGHALRVSPADPPAQVTFTTDDLAPRAPTRRRPGRPKAAWTVNNIQYLDEITQSARNREGAFAV